MTTRYTKIVSKTYISILLELNCVTQFDLFCAHCDQANVKFIARSDDILISALQKWDQFSLVCSISLKKKKKDFRPGSSF